MHVGAMYEYTSKQKKTAGDNIETAFFTLAMKIKIEIEIEIAKIAEKIKIVFCWAIFWNKWSAYFPEAFLHHCLVHST